MLSPTLQEFPRNDNPKPQPTRLVVLALLLATIAAVLMLPVFFRGEPGNQTALAREPQASPSPTPWLSPGRNLKDCIKDSAWPTAFEIPFSDWHDERFQIPPGSPPQYGEWKGNLLRYQYLETPGIRTAYFRSQWVHCPNLTGVPLTFFEKPCEFLFPFNPTTHQYDAYVYSWHPSPSHPSTIVKMSFKLASNFGPPVPDLAARYQAVLPSCLSDPLSHENMPVWSPPGVAADWFLTSGTAASPAPTPEMGYYAAIATPVPGASPDPRMYKPPYSFAGSVPGVHKPETPPQDWKLIPGQIVYDWKNFKIMQSFDPKVFAPPVGYQEIEGKPEAGVPKVCPVCHLTDEKANGPKYFIEKRRP